MRKHIMVVCGMGLGSSFYIEIHIQAILSRHALEDQYEVSHQAVFDVDWEMADYIVVGKDLEEMVPDGKNKIVLESIIDQEELEQKLIRALSGAGE